MAETIRDGTGKSFVAQVGPDHRLFTDAVSAERVHYSNHVNEQAYTATFEVTPTAAGDKFFYLKNISDTDLTVWSLLLRSSANEAVEIVLGDTGTPSAGTDLTATNRNTKSGNTPDATIQTGSDITGLSGGSVSDRIYVQANNESRQWACPCGIIVGKNKTFVLQAKDGNKELSITILFEYHNKES